MRTRTATITVRCPGLPDVEAGCPHKLEITIDPPERRTHDYPGCPASISGVEGCPVHRDALSTDRLWDLVDEREAAGRRDRD